MLNIEVKCLNPEVLEHSERMMVTAARLTQRGAEIKNMQDLIDLYNRGYKETTASAMAAMPHSTIKRFGKLDFAIVGASRRFLGQIRTHQVGVHFVSGSLQYSDYSGLARFCVPYEILEFEENVGLGDNFYIKKYLGACKHSLKEYEDMIRLGIPHDAAAYAMPQGLRNILIISVEPLELAHIIEQRACNRNSLETQYVVLKMWEEVFEKHAVFANCGPACSQSRLCPEGNMSCGKPLGHIFGPRQLLETQFPILER